MSEIRILWKDFPSSDWEKVISALPRSNIYQDWNYAEAARIANNIGIHRGLIYRNQKPIGLVQGFETRYLFGFKLIRFIRGPLFIEKATPAERLSCYAGIKRSCRLIKRQMAVILPELSYSDASDKSFKSINLNRIFAGMETNWLNLSLPFNKLHENLSKSWQRDVKKAESHEIRIDFEGSLDDILPHHAQHKSNKGYNADSIDLYKNLPNEKLIIVNAIQAGKIIASALFILHSKCATYQIGWSDEGARKINAQKLLMWQSVEHLKERGVTWLDLGAMDQKSAPGVTKFKQGLGGDTFILSGTYI